MSDKIVETFLMFKDISVKFKHLISINGLPKFSLLCNLNIFWQLLGYINISSNPLTTRTLCPRSFAGTTTVWRAVRRVGHNWLLSYKIYFSLLQRKLKISINSNMHLHIIIVHKIAKEKLFRIESAMLSVMHA